MLKKHSNIYYNFPFLWNNFLGIISQGGITVAKNLSVFMNHGNTYYYKLNCLNWKQMDEGMLSPLLLYSKQLHPKHKDTCICIKYMSTCVWIYMHAFELWHWRRLLIVSWTSRRSNQSILQEISPEYSLEGLMPKPKLQNSGHLMWIADSFEKTLMLGKIEGRRRRGWQRMGLLDGITKAMDMSLSRL